MTGRAHAGAVRPQPGTLDVVRAPHRPARARTRARDLARAYATDWHGLLLGVLVLSAVYVAWHLGRGWVAHDEGTLALSANRVMQGEMPHRDFDELYTGGLTYLNAFAFRVLDVKLMSLRLVLFAVFLAWVPAVFYVASRFVRPVAAAGLTLLCVVWSVPNYTAPLPSWYNLFLTVFAVAALFRWLENRRTRWLVVAGLASGLSLLVKVIGLYAVAAVLLFLVFQAHEQSFASARSTPHRGPAYRAFVTAALLSFVAALLAVVRHQLYAAEVVEFVMPGTLIAALLIRNEWTQPAGASPQRVATLAKLIGPYLAGFALPVVLFLIPFARAHALGDLFNGVFVLSAKRFGVAGYRMMSPWSMLALLPLVLLAVFARQMSGRLSRMHVIGLAVVLAAYLAGTASVPLLYRLVWYAVRALLPALVLIGVVVLARHRPADAERPLLRGQTMLLLAMAALFTLVQFPFSVPIYFCYVAPLVVLVAVALSRYTPPVANALPVLASAFLIAFAVLRVNTSMLFGMGVLYKPYPPTAPLVMPRGGLQVPDYDAAIYNVTVGVLQQHARGGYTWASPDCPEIYFLAGLRNPTRSLFDFFDDRTDRSARILSALERKGVTAVVLNRAPQFSPHISDELIAELERRYPFGANLGKFQVRWQ